MTLRPSGTYRERAVALLAGLLLAGCGEEGRKPAEIEEKARPEAVTEAVGAGRALTMQFKILRSGNIPGTGEYSFEGTGSMRGDGSRAVAEGELVDVEDVRKRVEVRVDGKDAWLRADGGEWITMDKPGTVERSFVPHYLLDVFAAAKDLDDAGDGHFRGLADVTSFREKIPEIGAETAPGTEVPVDLWVAGGKPKRLRMDFNSGAAGMFLDVEITGYEDRPPPGPPT